jgi:parallel beta-helix repeat protein
MTLVDTYFNPVPNGWNNFGYDTTYLWADILVTGEQANAAFDHFGLITGPGTFNIGIGSPSSFDSSGGLVYEGMLLPASWQSQGYPSAFTDQIPVSGTFSVTNCYLYGTDSAVWVENTLDASVTIDFNSITSSPSMIALADLSSTQVWVYGNQMTNVMYAAGVIAEQSVFQYNLLPSTIYVTGNYIESNWWGSGVWVQDYGPSEGLASTLSVVATGNDFVFDNSCGCANLLYAGALGAVDTVSAILSGNAVFQGGWGVFVSGGPATVSGNLILGTYDGVYLYAANYTHVTGNVIKNSGYGGINVTGDSSYDTIAYNLVKGSGLYDLYWDQTGIGDLWYGNIYATSSPATLP